MREEDDEFIATDYNSLRNADGWQRRDPRGGSSESRPKRVSVSSTPFHIILTLSSTSLSLYTSAMPTATSRTSVFPKSGEAPPLADDGRLAETQSLFKSPFDMIEAELIAMVDRARQAGCIGSSPFESRSPFAPTNTSISYATSSLLSYSPVMISSSNVPAGFKYVHVGCHEDGVDEVQIGKRMFHQCPEQFEEHVFHDMPGKVDSDVQVCS